MATNIDAMISPNEKTGQRVARIPKKSVMSLPQVRPTSRTPRGRLAEIDVVTPSPSAEFQVSFVERREWADSRNFTPDRSGPSHVWHARGCPCPMGISRLR